MKMKMKEIKLENAHADLAKKVHKDIMDMLLRTSNNWSQTLMDDDDDMALSNVYFLVLQMICTSSIMQALTVNEMMSEEIGKKNSKIAMLDLLNGVEECITSVKNSIKKS